MQFRPYMKGWYPDPEGQPFYRYWSGGNWTERTKTAKQLRRSDRLRAARFVGFGFLSFMMAAFATMPPSDGGPILLLALIVVVLMADRAVRAFRQSFSWKALYKVTSAPNEHREITGHRPEGA